MSAFPGSPPTWLAEDADGQTPLDPDEARGLKLSFVTTLGDLNAAEASNIASGMKWAEGRIKGGTEVATADFLSRLHRKLFGQVWEWAGRYRRTERNIGVDPLQIRVEVYKLFQDVEAWREFNTYPLDEQAARLHHRLTWIHPFPNGNGRTSRAMADLFLASRGAQPFSWGANTGLAPQENRTRYLEAVRAGDGHDLAPLLAFVRS